MKILVVHNEYCRSGGEDAVVSSEQAALRAKGHTVIEYRRSNSEFSLKSRFQKVLFLAGEFFFSHKTVRELSRLIERERPDVVHVHNIFFCLSSSVYAACRRFSVPVVQTLHNYRYLCANALLFVKGGVCERCLGGNLSHAVTLRCRNNRIGESLWGALWVFWLRRSGALNTVNRFIALSRFSRSRFVAAGFDESKIAVKPNFSQADLMRTEPGSFVLYAGALTDYKGVDDLMRIIESSRGIPFVIVGGGPKENEVRQWYASLGDGHSVQFKGEVSHAVLKGLLSQTAVLLFTSRCYENFPRIIVEAFSCGVPVVAADNPVMKEIVTGGSGLLYRSLSEAKEQLREMFYKKEINHEAGERAVRCYLHKYTEEENMRALESLYTDALKNEVN